MKRWFAPIGTRTDQPIRQFWGVPRPGSTDFDKVEMRWPRVVVLFAYEDGPMLYRYTAAGQFAGDTWHESLEQARDQASFEYSAALGPWHEIPDNVAKGAEMELALKKARTL